MFQPIEFSEIWFHAIGAIDVEDLRRITFEPKSPGAFPCATSALHHEELVPGSIFIEQRGKFLFEFSNPPVRPLFTLNLLINYVDRHFKDGHLELLVNVIHVLLIMSDIVATLEVFLFSRGSMGGTGRQKHLEKTKINQQSNPKIQNIMNTQTNKQASVYILVL